jgi:hypothetical protein
MSWDQAIAASETPTNIVLLDEKDDANRMTVAGDIHTLQVGLRYLAGVNEDKCVTSEDLTQLLGSPTSDAERTRLVTLLIHPDLHSAVNNFVTNTNYFSANFGKNYGHMEFLGHIGAQRYELRYKDKARTQIRPSWHYHGRALDIKWVGWQGDGSGRSRLASLPCNGRVEVGSSSTQYRRLVAVEAGLRKWFGVVLNRNWPGHNDHFHVDCGQPVHLNLDIVNRATSWCYFIQSCIEALTDYQVGIHDGIYGPITRLGYQTLLSDLGMSGLKPHRSINEYYLFLDYVMMHGFGDRRAGHYRWDGYYAA